MIIRKKVENSEKYIERKLKEEVEKLDGLCLKLLPFQFKGLPDRLCLLPGGRLFFVETKSKGVNPEKFQKWVASKLKRLGFGVYTIDSIEQIHDIIDPQISLEKILQKVIQVTGISEESLQSSTRDRPIVEARQAYMIIARKLTKHSKREITKLINKDHSTLNYALKNDHLESIKSIIYRTGFLWC